MNWLIFCALTLLACASAKELECESFRGSMCIVSDANLTAVKEVNFDTKNFPSNRVDRVIIKHSDMTDVPKGIFSSFENLRFFALKFNNLLQWKSGYLLGADELASIIVIYNPLTRLDDGAFTRAPNLMKIDFSSNNIQHISPKAFSGLLHLKSLRLGENKFGPNLHTDSFNLIGPTLLNLDIGSCIIASFPDKFFDDFHALEDLKIENNKLAELNFGVLPITLKNITIGKACLS